MDYKKLLVAYLRHVALLEGTDFLGGRRPERVADLMEHGLTEEEAAELLIIADVEWRR